MPLPRASGLLLHPTSLPGGHGIGDLGPQAYRFVEMLEAAGQGCWQILPLGPIGPSHSPYQALSSFAGNPLLISLERLAQAGLLREADLQGAPTSATERVDYQAVRRFKVERLRRACAAFHDGGGTPRPEGGTGVGIRGGVGDGDGLGGMESFATFRREQAGWLEDFALFMALKETHRDAAWWDWPAAIRARKPEALAATRQELARAIDFHAWCQYVFFAQWAELKAYANARGIRIVGDVPIYTAGDSADVWAEPRFFEVDPETGATLKMAGCPPDYFAADGQLWGNPIYKWDLLKAEGYDWWLRRLRAVFLTCDVVRIDHFRGFESYWEIPGGAETAREGRWVPGPGDDFFAVVEKELGELPFIAEDLGIITEAVTALRERHGLPGMKVLQFAFCEGADFYRPHTYDPNCVVYTGTHDNDTSKGWYAAEGADYAHMDRSAIEAERDLARRYLARDGSDIAWDLMRLASQSVADTCIFPMQDVLCLGNEARMNRPGVSGGQWAWRMTEAQFAHAPTDGLRELAFLYDRLPAPPEGEPAKAPE